MFSQTTEYALRAMTCLAESTGQLVPTPALAKRANVPENYLAKVLQLLAGAELIVGRRGVGGGYRLARPASDISLLDVVNAVDSISRTPLETVEPSLVALDARLEDSIRLVIAGFSSCSLHELTTENVAS